MNRPTRIDMVLHAAAMMLLSMLSLDMSSAQERLLLRGTVRDSMGGEPMVAANVHVPGTPRGTITNTVGAFALPLEPSDSLAVVSYLGYLPETLSVRPLPHQSLSILLRPSPIAIREVLVLGEDPAVDIIRKAIANKHRWMDRLHTYRFEAYTRQVLRRDTAIASVTEAFTTGYAARGDTLREIVRQKRQTSNIPVDRNFAAVRNIVNFNDDAIDLFRLRANDATVRFVFTGPTAPDALDHYDVRLLRTRRVAGIETYEIALRPKNRLEALFDGTITIAGGTYAVMGVDVRPTALDGIPFVTSLDLRYRQEFSLVDSTFWMPTTIHVSGGFSASIVGFSLPRIGIEQLSSLSDYRINIPLPDSILQRPRVSVDSSAATYDTAYWSRPELIPLSAEETRAYTALDSGATLEKQFRPSGPLGTLSGGGTETLLGALDLRYNRVEGLYGGVRKTIVIPRTATTVSFAAGYGFAAREFSYSLGATLQPKTVPQIRIGASRYELLEHRPDGEYYGTAVNSIGSFIDGSDARDYYRVRGMMLSLSSRVFRQATVSLLYRSERQTSRGNETSFALFSRPSPFRPNPAIDDGRLHALEASFRLGQPGEEIELAARNALSVAVEMSAPSVTGGDFEYVRTTAAVDLSVSTFARALLFPPVLRIRAFGGISGGTLPAQRTFVADARLGMYGPFGTLRGAHAGEIAGDRIVVVACEENLRTVPFVESGLSFLSDRHFELLLHAAGAQAWRGTTPRNGGWYAEAGIGVARLLDLLRADLIRRFTPPSGFVVTIGIATIF